MSREREDFRYHYADLQAAFPDRKLITKRQFAEYLGIGLDSIYSWDIPTVNSGRKEWVPIISAARWLAGGGSQS